METINFDDFESFTDWDLAKTFIKLYGHLYVYKNYKIYFFNGNIWITENSKTFLYSYVSENLYNTLLDIIKLKYNVNDKNYDKYIYKLNKRLLINNSINNIISQIQVKLHVTDYSNIIFDVDKKDINVINFKNGILDISKLKLDETKSKIINFNDIFRKRVYTDYFCMCLPYDFIIDTNQLYDDNQINIYNKVIDIYKQINNNNTDLFNETMNWYAYNLIGNTNYKGYMCHLGDSLQHLSSLETKIHNICASIYSAQISSRFFNKNHNKTNKIFLSLNKLPIRHVYINKFNKEHLNVDLIEKYINNYYSNRPISLNNLQFKLNLINGYNQDFGNPTCEMRKNGLFKKFEICYGSEEDYNKAINKTNLQICNDIELLNLFTNNDLYKNAYIHILLPRVVNIINEGLNMNKLLFENFNPSI